MRTDSTAIAGVAMGEARDVIGERYGDAVHDAQGPRLQDEVEGRPGGARVDPPDELPARPGLAGRHAQARGAAPLPADLAARARVADGAPRSSRRRRSSWPTAPYELRASRDAGRCSTASPGSTPRAATTTPTTTRTSGRLPALAEGDATDASSTSRPTQHFTEPPPRFTEATLIKALEEHGIGRPSTYAATISTIVDRGYVRVEERRLHPEPVGEIVTDLLVEHFGDYVDLEFTARMEEELDEVARGERAWVPLLRAFYGPLRDRVDEKRTRAQAQRLHDRGDRRGLLAKATRWSSGSAATGGSWPARCIPEHKETRPLPGEEPPPQEGDRRGLPEVRRGHARRQARPVRAVRRLLALPGLHYIRRTARRRPTRCRSRSSAPRTRTATSSPRRARRTGNVFWGCSNYPKCDFTTNHEPLGGLHDADDGPLARKGEAAICLNCGSTSETPPDDIVAGRAATRVARRTRRRSRGRRAAAAAAAARRRRAEGGGRPRGGRSVAAGARRRAQHAAVEPAADA